MYDAIIIGAGISGLVCGCYLAKAGMKVLICEQHYKPGGYCTSFKRQGFTFDAAAHCFGSYRKDGIMRKILKDLEVDKKLTIIRPDPSDIIFTSDYTIHFWNDFGKTLEEFKTKFPEDSTKINNFFQLLLDTDPKSFSILRNLTFKNLLDQFFLNDKLKAVLSFPFLGISGLPSSLISAFVGAKLYSEFLIDGGYYPKGGMQLLPDSLAQRFREFGGEIRLSSLVQKIKIKDNKIVGIILENVGFVPSRYVISNCDAMQTFFNLIGKRDINGKFSNTLKKMVPSLSMFILYLGIDKYFNALPRPGTNVWFLPHYDIDNLYLSAKKRNISNLAEYMIRVSPNENTIFAFVNSAFKNKRYWDNNKNKLSDTLIKNIEKHTIPNLSEHIKYKEAATPHTLHRYTRNHRGAAFGWAGIPTQFALPELRKPSFIQNLYLTGHWTTLGVGISGVAYVGYDTSKLILRRKEEIGRMSIS